VDDKPVSPELDDADLLQSGDHSVEIPVGQNDQIRVGDVAGGDDGQATSCGREDR
jgi:hypothetical protein